MISPSHRETRMLAASGAAIREAALILRRGGLVVFPTETVYGLGADALNPVAVRDMFLAKGRPPDHPVIVHVAEASLVDRFAIDLPDAARRLGAAFWPGPLTLILRRSPLVSDLVTGGLETVGLRVPAHPAAQALLQEFGGPIAAPSANPFGRVSATRAAHALDDLHGRVDLILDDGPCQVGLESTIVDLTSAVPTVLRPGAITMEQIAEVLGTEIRGMSTAAPRVSGSLPSHYAPRARVELVPAVELATRARALAGEGRKVAVLGPESDRINGQDILFLLIGGSKEDFARKLYDLLREADQQGCEVVLATLPAEERLGAAIADRLRKAAGPRPDY